MKHIARLIFDNLVPIQLLSRVAQIQVIADKRIAHVPLCSLDKGVRVAKRESATQSVRKFLSGDLMRTYTKSVLSQSKLARLEEWPASMDRAARRAKRSFLNMMLS